jgi:formyltetrahydrofolate-dependent phosphoribosylglycinamide formyltransferase
MTFPRTPPVSDSPLRLGVLISGGGTTLANLLGEKNAGRLPVEFAAVIASRPGVRGIQIAEDAGLPVVVVRRSAFPSTEAFSDEVFRRLRDAQVDLVVLAGFLSLLAIPGDYAGRVMNIHPALLPAFGGKGFYGKGVHEAVLASGVKVSGCTVHFADNAYDRGPIILQRSVPVEEGDTPETLAARVFEEECRAYPEAIRLYASGRLRVEGKVVRVQRHGSDAL